MSKKAKHLARLLGLLLMVQALGCASQYHRYSDCCGVNCRYCEPAPLPYRHYPGCVCHSKPGARYLSGHPVQTSQTEITPTDVTATEEHETPPATAEPDSSVEIQRTINISRRPYED